MKSADLRIDSLRLGDPAHLELAALDTEGEPALHKVERILAELLVTPTAQDIEILADAGGERLEVVGTRDQARGDAGFLGPDLQQQFQKVADENGVLRKARPARLTVRHLLGR